MRILKRKKTLQPNTDTAIAQNTDASIVSDSQATEISGSDTTIGNAGVTPVSLQLDQVEDWTEKHGDRAVKLAIGLGWQVAIIYLSTLTPSITQNESTDSKRQALPPRNLISKTIKSRTTSLALPEYGTSQSWAGALSKLLDSDYKNEQEARELAQELHIGLIDSLAVTGNDMRPAYELGRLLSEAVLLATATTAKERPRVYRQLFDPIRLLPLAEWLASLDRLLPLGVAQAVFTSLQNWSRWISAAGDEDFARADDALREQARIWRDLLLGRVFIEDLPDREENNALSDFLQTKAAASSSITESLADISLSAAFRNRLSLDTTGVNGKENLPDYSSLASKATKLPTDNEPDLAPKREENSDIHTKISSSQVQEAVTGDLLPKEDPVSEGEEKGETVISLPPAAIEPATQLDNESDGGQLQSLPISRFSLDTSGLKADNGLSAQTEDVTNAALDKPQFKNDISSVIGTLDEQTQNSWLEKYTQKSGTLAFEPDKSESDIWNTSPPQHSDATQEPTSGYHNSQAPRKRHPGFDLDIYEDFDFDFAPGFAPDFDPKDNKTALADKVTTDFGFATNDGTLAGNGGAKVSEPELLPFDLSILENFNINTAEPTFTPKEQLPNTAQTYTELPGQNNYYQSSYQRATGGTTVRSGGRDKAPSSSRRRLRLLSFLFAVVALLFAAKTFVATPIEVTQNQISPAIKAGEWVLMSKISTVYHQGDIIKVSQQALGGSGTGYFARIIALPGQAITSSENSVYVNGVLVNQKPWYKQMLGSCKGPASIPQEVVPASNYVVVIPCLASQTDKSMAIDIRSQYISGKIIAVIWKNSHPWFHWL